MTETMTTGAADSAFAYDTPSRIAPLSELADEYEVADGYPDLRGWDVRDALGRSIGYVYDLIVDVGALRVRYLDVELDPQFARSDADRRVLIPTEVVDLERDRDEAVLRGVEAAEVHSLVPYARRGVVREREAAPPAPPPIVPGDVPSAPPAEKEIGGERHFDDSRWFSAAASETAAFEGAFE